MYTYTLQRVQHTHTCTQTQKTSLNWRKHRPGIAYWALSGSNTAVSLPRPNSILDGDLQEVASWRLLAISLLLPVYSVIFQDTFRWEEGTRRDDSKISRQGSHDPLSCPSSRTCQSAGPLVLP